jgi:hypothetical protein
VRNARVGAAAHAWAARRQRRARVQSTLLRQARANATQQLRSARLAGAPPSGALVVIGTDEAEGARAAAAAWTDAAAAPPS